MGLVYFTVVCLAILHISTGCPQPSPEIEPCQRYQVSRQCNPTRGSFFSNDPGVAIFTSVFARKVYGSDTLRELFDFSQTTPLEYSQFLYKYLQYAFDYYRVSNGEALAEFSVRGVVPNFDVLTLPLMVSVKGNVAANSLFVEGILTVENAVDLAITYAETFENNALRGMTEDPTSKFQVLDESFFNFILSADDNAIAMAPVIAYYYGTEWFVAAVNKWVDQY